MNAEFRFKNEETKKKFEAENFDELELRKFVERPMIRSKISKLKGYTANDGVITEIEIR